jgi:non-homologous end joining protein Ku
VVVERNDLVRGYEFAKDQYVRFAEAELETLESEASKSIDLKEFVPLSKIDPVSLKAPTILVRMKAERNRTSCWPMPWPRQGGRPWLS